ncbi:TonB-dependent receptor [Mucilaginibacter mali]|uniref:TonB-dependent receptor n=1 Tax=Mucilaginibacter mali TaxID=2740462 RepID=A0A7D4UL38_9SPHI|nr:carboxypeptidase regulatory-like domain-containing protein [Mucilaginibacter mali]QKJ29241.1 TonB-dependent receptor [Mucilaginibacter mali]
MIATNKWLGAFILWMLLTVVCHAQTIKGTVTDSLGKPVSFASVNLKGAGNLIIAYTTSGDKGAFSLNVPADADKNGLQLEVSCIGFKKESKPVGSFTTPYNFKLHGAVSMLKTVTIKDNKPRARLSGDTLSYKVSDFSSPQDRVIGDVIKKLPGIDVDDNGKIKYNGKAISNLYIGGDNLLDDKYNIATKTIPNGVVDQVQVMENHQPIKMLKDKVNSDDVALNLTIKKDAKLQLIGQETVGAGLPGNYYGELNAMMFKDKYKAINYIKGNNVGNDVSNDLVSHNLGDYLARIDNDKPGAVLSLGTAGDPDLPRNRYLFNRAGLFNLNNLWNLKKDVQFRTNFSYLRDAQRQDYTKTTDIFSPNTGNIHYSETQRNSRRPDLFHTQVLLNVNKPKFYLNDNLVADYSHNSSYSALVSNGVPLNQNFKDNLADFSNEFNYMNTFKSNNIIELYSYVDHISEPESRDIEPNLNPNIFNHGVNYNLLTQHVNIPTWFTNNYVSYKIPRAITQSYKVGFSAQSQQLNSDLTITQNNGTYNLVADSARNNLDWKRNKLYGEAGYDFPGKILKFSVQLPVNLLNSSYSDPHYKQDVSQTNLYFNPRASLKYQSGIENYFTLNYGYRNQIGNIQDIYRGSILSNYRSIVANNADLTERQSQNAGIAFNYHKAITLFFFGLSANYSHVSANTISSSILDNNISRRIVLPFDNNIDSWNFSGSISKYNFDLRTTFSANASYATTKLNQLQNGLTLPYNTISKGFGVGADTKVSQKVNFSYKANLGLTTSKSSAVATSSDFQRLVQSASVNYAPLANLYFNISGDHYYTHQQAANDLKYMFADASIRYRFTKTKLDLEVTAQNLFDTKNYTAVYLSANVYTSSTYTIPGRIVLAKMMFTL